MLEETLGTLFIHSFMWREKKIPTEIPEKKAVSGFHLKFHLFQQKSGLDCVVV